MTRLAAYYDLVSILTQLGLVGEQEAEITA
jgi:hypothetical protein